MSSPKSERPWGAVGRGLHSSASRTESSWPQLALASEGGPPSSTPIAPGLVTHLLEADQGQLLLCVCA